MPFVADNTAFGDLGTPVVAQGLVGLDNNTNVPGSESWTIVAVFDVDRDLLTAGNADCDPVVDSSTASGFANFVDGSVTDFDLSNNDACLPMPLINLSKSAAFGTQVGFNLVEIVYTITATNTGTGDGIYDIVEDFMPGAGITLIEDATTPTITYISGPGESGFVTSPFTDGDLVVDDASLAAGATDVWEITALFTIEFAESSVQSRNCTDDDDEEGNTGFNNFVDGSSTDRDLTDNEDCVPFIITTTVPTLSQWSMILMALMLLAVGWIFQPATRRRFN